MRRALLVIASSALFSACGSMPTKPTLKLYDIDFPRGEAIEHDKEPGVPSQYIGRVPLSFLDKAKCLPPEEWMKLIDYIELLELAIQTEQAK